MNGLIAGFGLGLLIALASAVGVAADGNARDSAWRRIASARRANHEESSRLREWSLDLHVRERTVEVREDELDRREHGLARRAPALHDES